jgi:hypothetical protein
MPVTLVRWSTVWWSAGVGFVAGGAVTTGWTTARAVSNTSSPTGRVLKVRLSAQECAAGSKGTISHRIPTRFQHAYGDLRRR